MEQLETHTRKWNSGSNATFEGSYWTVTEFQVPCRKWNDELQWSLSARVIESLHDAVNHSFGLDLIWFDSMQLEPTFHMSSNWGNRGNLNSHHSISLRFFQIKNWIASKWETKSSQVFFNYLIHKTNLTKMTILQSNCFSKVQFGTILSECGTNLHAFLIEINMGTIL